VIIDEVDYLEHYGTPRRSGRYPWGSGGIEPSLRRNMDFLDNVESLKRQGLSEPDIAKGLGTTTTQLRAKRTIANQAIKSAQIHRAQSLRDKGWSNVAGGKEMGINESSFRALLEPGAKDRNEVLTKTSDMLRREVNEKKYLDIGTGSELYVGNGVSPEKLKAAVAILKEEGYNVHTVKIPQQGTGLDTNFKVLVPPGITQKEVFLNPGSIRQIAEFTPDGGRTYGKIHPPISINPNRIQINYKEDGGSDRDGVIFVKPGVKDLDLGKARYAQVRIMVDNTHYMKGMAMYKDNLPPGTDLVFNTAKERKGSKLDALKPINADPSYPFGSVVRQIVADPGTPHERVTSALNIVNEEGDWGAWSKTLSSQFLSKQSPALAKQQLDTTYARRRKDLDEIISLTNPTVKKKLLEDFAGDTDSAAIDLKAATFPNSAWHAILPLSSLHPKEVYAPNYANGTEVALIRYPHGGTFEIPKLIVNNRNREGRKLLGSDTKDAIGIHHDVAKRLSGADFDGDTVLVIPNPRRIKDTPALDGLKNFDPIHEYSWDGPNIGANKKQTEMGKISNLITDMTIQQAPHEHIARAVRHSMVVIDAEKHNLNYKESERVNGIPALKQEYQGRTTAGAATLISRQGRTVRIADRKLRRQSKGGSIEPTTGRKVFEPTNKTRRDKSGNVIPKTQKIKVLGEVEAHALSSGTPIEHVYAEHSNKLKGLADEARLAILNTPRLTRSPSAAKVYAREVSSLDAKLKIVISNRPRERAAQAISGANIKAIMRDNPDLSRERKKKIRFAELEKARTRMGVRQRKVEISPEEWNAIQAGAISENKLSQILQKSEMTIVRKMATPKRQVLMTPTQTSRAQAMLRSGATRAEVANALGVSLTTLDVATHSALERVWGEN
jgi:hypothetical protein